MPSNLQGFGAIEYSAPMSKQPQKDPNHHINPQQFNKMLGGEGAAAEGATAAAAAEGGGIAELASLLVL